MQNTVLRTLSLALLAIVVTYSPSAFGQDRLCTLQLKVIDLKKVEMFDVRPITGAHAVAIQIGNRKSIAAVLVDGQPQFPKLIQGEYRLTITKAGFNRTIQELDFVCNIPGKTALAYVKLRRGSSARTFISQKFSVTAGRLEIVASGKSESLSTPSSPNIRDERAGAITPSSSIPVVRGGVVNGKAISLPKPEYPAAARSARVSGTVSVQVLIDEEGNVIFATAVSGPPLLEMAAVEAARSARFKPTLLSGQPVKVSGVINYNFALQ